MAQKPTNLLVQLILSEDIRGILDSWRKERKLSWSKMYLEAIDEFLEWYPGRPEGWHVKNSMSGGIQQSFRVPPDKHALLEDIQEKDWSDYPIRALQWSVLTHYMRVHDLFERSWGETPAITSIRLPEEDVRLIRAYVKLSHYDSETAFFEQALWTWHDKRNVHHTEQPKTPYLDYFPLPEKGESMSVCVDQGTHSLIKAWAVRDLTTIKAVYYNAVREELDRLLDDEDVQAIRRLSAKLLRKARPTSQGKEEE